ncbi:MAG: asparagine synthase (glutamine-hydrolyzing) [bacterium]
MCGIAGLFRRDGTTVDPQRVVPMLAIMRHRGPDDTGIWHDRHAAFGHNRLTILDLSAKSRQPILTRDAQGVLAYNGEIYNYLKLRQTLEREGMHFTSTGDAEVLLQALHHWGPERSLPLLNGMFAFAYLDRRTNTLWLARDRLGIKPLLVAQAGAELIFASEAKAILQHPAVPTRVDRLMLMQRLMYRQRASHKYLFEGLDAVEAGHWWRIHDAGIEKNCYAHVLQDLDVARLAAAAGKVDRGALVATFQEHLQQSVKLHLASDVPVAAMVSGGVDSSLIASYAHQYLPGLQGYVADVSGKDSEGDQAQRVGQHIGMPVHRVQVDREQFLRLLPTAVWHSDGFIYHPSDPALLAVAQKCRADGIKVLLTGEGADELFGGYAWYAKTHRRWDAAFGRSLFPRRHLKQKRAQLMLSPFCTLPGMHFSALQSRMVMAFDANAEILPYRLMKLLEPVEPPADRAMLAHMFFDLYDHLSWILHRHDRMGMAASMEMRVPFLENGMFDFAFHLPASAKLHRGISKWVVKKAAEKCLPGKIVYAKKKGFPVPHTYSKGTAGILTGGLLAEQMQWTVRTTRELVDLAEQGDAGLRLHIIGAELWLRLFFAHENPEALGEKLVSLARASGNLTFPPQLSRLRTLL